VLIDCKGLDRLDEVWGQVQQYATQARTGLKDAKRRVLEFADSEFTVLTRLLGADRRRHYSLRDYSRQSAAGGSNSTSCISRSIAPIDFG